MTTILSHKSIKLSQKYLEEITALEPNKAKRMSMISKIKHANEDDSEIFFDLHWYFKGRVRNLDHSSKEYAKVNQLISDLHECYE